MTESDKQLNWHDPIVEEIHRFREQHAQEVNFDSHRMFNKIKKGEEELRAEGWTFVSLPAKHPNKLTGTDN